MTEEATANWGTDKQRGHRDRGHVLGNVSVNADSMWLQKQRSVCVWFYERVIRQTVNEVWSTCHIRLGVMFLVWEAQTVVSFREDLLPRVMSPLINTPTPAAAAAAPVRREILRATWRLGDQVVKPGCINTSRGCISDDDFWQKNGEKINRCLTKHKCYSWRERKNTGVCLLIISFIYWCVLLLGKKI